jgi:hypothetical protein
MPHTALLPLSYGTYIMSIKYLKIRHCDILSIDVIAQIAGLSVDEIKQLQEEIA